MRFSLLSLLALVLVATGCTTMRPGGTTGPIVGPTWALTTLGTDRPLAPDATLMFGPDGRVSGSTGCNSYFGTYTLSPTGVLSITNVGSTRMACAGPAMEQERRILAALTFANRATVLGGRLALTSATGQLLTFEAARTNATISGTVAYRERIALPPNAVVEVMLLDVSGAVPQTVARTTVGTAGRQVPIPFSLGYDSARIEARNRYALRAEIRSAAGELMWITDPVVPALGSGMATTNVMLMLNQVQATGSASGALVGPTWQLAELRTAAGVVLTLDAGAPYSVMFGADGRYSGQADCNRIGGSFEAMADGMVRLSQGLSTLAACPDGSAAGDMLTVMSGVDRYSLAGTRLTLSGTSGTLVFTRG